MAKQKTITLAKLQSCGVCQRQVKLFEKHFGQSVRVTRNRALKVAFIFNWTWAADHLLSAPACRTYYEDLKSALGAYGEAMASAQRTYYEAMATAFVEAYLSDE